jgi:hypothetical protein
MQKYQRFWRSVVAALVVIVGLMVVAMTPLAQADKGTGQNRVILHVKDPNELQRQGLH